MARARAGETDAIPGSTNSAGINGGLASSILNDTAVGPSNPNGPTEQVPTDDADKYDIFADDDEDTTARPSSEGNKPVPHDNGAVGESKFCCCIIYILNNRFHFLDLSVILIGSAHLQMEIHRVITCMMRLQGIVSLFF